MCQVRCKGIASFFHSIAVVLRVFFFLSSFCSFSQPRPSSSFLSLFSPKKKSRAATSPAATARAASPSTARSSPTRTSRSSTLAPESSRWPTPAPGPTARRYDSFLVSFFLLLLLLLPLLLILLLLLPLPLLLVRVLLLLLLSSRFLSLLIQTFVLSHASPTVSPHLFFVEISSNINRSLGR